MRPAPIMATRTPCLSVIAAHGHPSVARDRSEGSVSPATASEPSSGPAFFDCVVDALVRVGERNTRALGDLERERLGALGLVQLAVHDRNLRDRRPDVRERQLLEELLDAWIDGVPVGI